jgi:transglutaminase-like putative cysteine protease
MQMHILHETVYRYAEPVKRSVQNLRLTPRRDSRQRVTHWQMHAPGRTNMQVDAHGNVVHLLTLDEPHREIRIAVRGVVDTEDRDGEPFFDEGRLSPLAYLAETPLTAADESLERFTAKYLRGKPPAQDELMELSSAVCDAVTYRKGVTEVHETAAQAFARGEGVCQDHAHVFVACCRAARIPARYVSGYFFIDDSTLHDASQVASHAWVDVWLGDAQGWISLDVTHRVLAGSRHCRLAVGRDYMEACPIRGVRRGGGTETMEVSVNVAAQAQQQQ